MRAILVALIGSSILVVTSCAAHNGGVGNGAVNSPQNSLTGKVKTIDDGMNITTYFYGLFGRVQEIDSRASNNPIAPPKRITNYSYFPLNQPKTVTVVTTITQSGVQTTETYIKVTPLVWSEWGPVAATLVRDPQGHTMITSYSTYTDTRKYDSNGNLQSETHGPPPNNAPGGSLTSVPNLGIGNSPENDGSDLTAGVRSMNVPKQWTTSNFTGLPPTVNFGYTLYNTGQVHTRTGTGAFPDGSSFYQNITYTYYP